MFVNYYVYVFVAVCYFLPCVTLLLGDKRLLFCIYYYNYIQTYQYIY